MSNLLDYSVKLLETTNTSPVGSESVSDRKTALQLVLIALAETHAKRLKRVSEVLETLENRVFNADELEEMEHRDVVRLYQLSVTAATESSEYISEMLATVKWEDLSTRLIEMSARNNFNPEGSAELGKAAETLMKKLLETLPNSVKNS